MRTAIAFLVGAFCSGLAGFIGMYIAVQANLRTAAAAQRSVKDAINVSLRGGAVSGFLVVALSLLGVLGMYAAFGGFNAAPAGATAAQRLVDGVASVPFEIVGFGFGASFVALFAQLGGGIYTKAADVGADLVGKVEAGIPEDDPRNAAVIADLVGDNVGDCAGRGADLFESTAAENIGAMILGVALYVATGNTAWVFFPLVVRSVGIIASMVGIMAVAVGDVTDPQRKLDQGYWAMTVIARHRHRRHRLDHARRQLLVRPGRPDRPADQRRLRVHHPVLHRWQLAARPGAGARVAHRPRDQHHLGLRGRPREHRRHGDHHLDRARAVVLLRHAGGVARRPALATGNVNPGLFGTAVATMGMLTTVAYILSMDTFGPITDNAGGIAEFAQAPEEVRHITDVLDGVGNTTKALTKGYAVGSAALAAFLLFSAYLDEVKKATGVDDLPGRPVQGAGVHRRLPGADADLLLQLAGHPRGRQGGRRRSSKRSAASSASTRASCWAPSGPTTPAPSTSPPRLACARWSSPGLLAVLFPIVVGLVLKAEAAAALPDGRHDGRHPDGHRAQQLGRHLGQRQEVHRAGHAQRRRRATCWAKAPTPTPRRSSATRSATRSRTPPARRCTCVIKLLSTITLVMAPLFIGR